MSSTENLRKDRTINVIAEILEVEPDSLKGEARLREDLGMDSLGSLELLSVIGEEMRIELEIDEAMGIVTVDDACAFVERNYSAQHA